MYIAKAFAHQQDFLRDIEKVPLPAGVVSVTPTLGEDWDGEPSVFFEIVLADHAVPRSELLAFTQKIRWDIRAQVRPLEEWGVLSYFRFLTETEVLRVREARLAS